MKQVVVFLIFILSVTSILGQDYKEYSRLVRIADSLYKISDFQKSAFTYSEAFRTIGWKGSQRDRYNAGRSWALAGFADSAFFQLDNIATKQNYFNYEKIVTDPDLHSLHSDKRWKRLVETIKQNKDKLDKAEANLNRPLIAQLDSIFSEDQKYRIQIDTIEKKHGWGSPQMKEHLELITKTDSTNLIEVKQILDKYGWLGPDVIGTNGSLTLFLIIQHADQATQEKYLPMMREAVKNGKAQASNLALLEDRVALRQGRKQIYGSQVARDKETNTYYILPLEDPDNVDKRRKEIGLQPLSEYVSQWKIKWDVEQYKSDLPTIEAKEKAKRN